MLTDCLSGPIPTGMVVLRQPGLDGVGVLVVVGGVVASGAAGGSSAPIGTLGGNLQNLIRR